MKGATNAVIAGGRQLEFNRAKQKLVAFLVGAANLVHDTTTDQNLHKPGKWAREGYRSAGCHTTLGSTGRELLRRWSDVGDTYCFL